MHGESRRQSPQQVPDKVVDLSWTEIMKVGDVICVADFHDLCPRQVRDFVGNLLRTLLQSRCNGFGLDEFHAVGLDTEKTMFELW